MNCMEQFRERIKNEHQERMKRSQENPIYELMIESIDKMISDILMLAAARNETYEEAIEDIDVALYWTEYKYRSSMESIGKMAKEEISAIAHGRKFTSIFKGVE